MSYWVYMYEVGTGLVLVINVVEFVVRSSRRAEVTLGARRRATQDSIKVQVGHTVAPVACSFGLSVVEGVAPFGHLPRDPRQFP